MSEGQTPQRRRRGTSPQPAPDPKPVKIVVSSGANEPDWVVSAGNSTGAASRRSEKTNGKKAAETVENGKDSNVSPVQPEQKTENAAGGKEKPAAQEKAGLSSTPRSGTTFVVSDTALEAPKKVPKKIQAKPKKKKRSAKVIRKGIVAILAAVAAIALLTAGIVMGTRLLDIKRTLDQGTDSFYPNLYMNGISLAGMTLNQAMEVVSQQVVNQIAGFKITLHTQDGRSWDITGSDLRMQYNVAEQLDQLWNVGHRGNSRERYEQVKAVEETPIYRTSMLAYDLSCVNQILTTIKEEVDEPAVNATKVNDDSKWPPFSYTDDVPGQTLDITGLNEKISGMVERLESGTVELTPTPVQAKVTRAELEGQIVKLSTYETAIGATSAEGRFVNIEIGTMKFNHLVVRSGDSVSFNKVTGKRTEANGFVEAPEIAYGEYVMGIGGGICQVSSTLYNCVINAGLEVVKRTQHTFASNYVPMGQDATVSDDRLDFIFRNSTSAPIYFETQYYKKKNYWYCQFTIYGRPDPNGYTYKLDSQVREEIPLPEPTYRPDRKATYVVYDTETYQYSKGEKGYIVDVYLVTMDQYGKEISRELKYTDTYKARAPVYYVGVTHRDTN